MVTNKSDNFSNVIPEKLWYWENVVPESFNIQRFDEEPYQDKVWFYSKNQTSDGFYSGVGVGIDHDFSMIGDLSDGNWDGNIENSTGILISNETWNDFTNWSNKIDSDQYYEEEIFLESGSLLSVNGMILDSGSDRPYAKLYELIWSLEEYLEEDINGDGNYSYPRSTHLLGKEPLQNTIENNGEITFNSSNWDETQEVRVRFDSADKVPEMFEIAFRLCRLF